MAPFKQVEASLNNKKPSSIAHLSRNPLFYGDILDQTNPRPGRSLELGAEGWLFGGHGRADMAYWVSPTRVSTYVGGKMDQDGDPC